MKKWHSLLLFSLLSITQVSLPVTELVGKHPASTWSWKRGAYSAAYAALNCSGKLASGLGKVGRFAFWKAPCTVRSMLSSTSGRCKLGFYGLGLAALYGTGKAILNRLYIINDVEYKVKGCCSKSAGKIFNWNINQFSAAGSLNSSSESVKKIFVQTFFNACKRNEFNIVVDEGRSIKLNDVLNKILREKDELSQEQKRLEPFINFSIYLFGRPHYLFGYERCYARLLSKEGMNGGDCNILVCNPHLLEEIREKCNAQRFTPYLLLRPNFYKAAQLYLEIQKLINHLNVLYSLCENNKELWGNGDKKTQINQTVTVNSPA